MRHSRLAADGSLQTTLADYAKFLETMLIVPLEDSPFGMEEQPQTVADAAAHVTWGLGLGLEEWHGRRSAFMGQKPGGSFFLLTPQTGDGVLLLAESPRGLALLPVAVGTWAPGRHPALKFAWLRP